MRLVANCSARYSVVACNAELPPSLRGCRVTCVRGWILGMCVCCRVRAIPSPRGATCSRNNVFVFLFVRSQVQGKLKEACDLAKTAFDDAIAEVTEP